MVYVELYIFIFSYTAAQLTYDYMINYWVFVISYTHYNQLANYVLFINGM